MHFLFVNKKPEKAYYYSFQFFCTYKIWCSHNTCPLRQAHTEKKFLHHFQTLIALSTPALLEWNSKLSLFCASCVFNLLGGNSTSKMGCWIERGWTRRQTSWRPNDLCLCYLYMDLISMGTTRSEMVGILSKFLV